MSFPVTVFKYGGAIKQLPQTRAYSYAFLTDSLQLHVNASVVEWHTQLHTMYGYEYNILSFY